MAPPISPLLFALLLFVGMQLFMEAGRRFAVWRRGKEPDADRSSLGIVEGAVFALFGLLMAFTFSGAASRFNEKRMLIAEEANTIETAWLRLALVPDDPRHALQDLFRKYLDSRLATYRKLPDMKEAESELANSKRLQEEIWSEAIAATRAPGAHPAAGLLLPPALNNMIDIVTTRYMSLHTHPPPAIHGLLFCLGLFCSLLAGYRMAIGQYRNWVHIMVFTLMTVLIIYVAIDVEYPRAGLFQLANADEILVNLRTQLN